MNKNRSNNIHKIYKILMLTSQQSQQSNQTPIILLPINKTQQYGWGYKNKNCLVSFMTEEDLDSYAQFWMGTHLNGQSKLTNELSLKNYLKHNSIQQPEFLFKILSIQKCLSIQAHPNQQQAKQLNKNFPQIYVDDRDKPQMFLTLSDQFELFLGFIEREEFQNLVKIQPFQSICASLPNFSIKEAVIWMLQELVDLDNDQIKKNIAILFDNLTQFPVRRQQILRRIFAEFGNDTGILVSCLLQYHVLPKESCFGIEAGVPHAYIKGQCFELMKNSDNVVRLGLTPKQKDIPNLLKIIKNNIEKTYTKIEPLQNYSVQKFEWNSYSITRMLLKKQLEEIKIQSNSIGIILDGSASMLGQKGCHSSFEIASKTVFFLKKGVYQFKGSGQVFFASKS